MESQLRICVILAVRNEFPYLRILLPMLAEQDLDLIILDNESTDGSHALYAQYMGKLIIRIETLPYRGFFSLTDKLAAKQAIIDSIDHDWVVHHDADEVLQHNVPGKTLRDAIEEADAAGYNVVNFDEFVFVPEPGVACPDDNHYTGILRYYFFEPYKNRRNQAWKRTAQLVNTSTGGHMLEGGGMSISPTSHIQRHYIVLNEEHARMKYLDRAYDDVDLERGWFGNRVIINRENLLLPKGNERFQVLDAFDSRNLSRAEPCATHFWQW